MIHHPNDGFISNHCKRQVAMAKKVRADTSMKYSYHPESICASQPSPFKSWPNGFPRQERVLYPWLQYRRGTFFAGDALLSACNIFCERYFLSLALAGRRLHAETCSGPKSSPGTVSDAFRVTRQGNKNIHKSIKSSFQWCRSSSSRSNSSKKDDGDARREPGALCDQVAARFRWTCLLVYD